MRRVRGLSNATKRLRGFGLAVIAMLASAGLALVGFSSAQSAADGSDSTVDYSLRFTNLGLSGTGLLIPKQLQFSVEFWVKPESDAEDGIFAQGASSGDRYYLERNSDASISLFSYLGGTLTTQPGMVPTGSWTHIAITHTSTTTTIYINAQDVISTGPLTSTGWSTRFGLGERWDAGVDFSGQIDQFKVWSNGDLSEADIQASMHSFGAGGVTSADLIRHYSFNEPGASIFYDLSSNPTNLTGNRVPERIDVKQVSAASDGDTVITFPRTYLPGVGGWTVPENATDFRALVVAGGGGGGGDEGGGGGAGGLTESAIAPASGSILNAVVGMGGFGAKNDVADFGARNGQDSQFGTLSTLGGGAGGDASNDGVPTRDGADGGSGGGRAGEGSSGVAGSGEPGQGNDGAATWTSKGNGGGGAGAAATGLDGGSGKAVSIIPATLANELAVGEVSGSSVYFAGGGGGGKGNQSSGRAGYGGLGGGSDGNGSSYDSPEAIPNTGGGGGGGGSVVGGTWNIAYSGNSGASGVVIVRYTPTHDLTYLANAKGDLHTNTNPIPTANNAAFTAEAWTYGTSNTGTWRVIFGGGTSLTSEAQRFFVGVNNSGQIWVDVAGAVNTSFNADIQLNRWTHIAVSVTGSTNPTVNLFVDGVLVKAFTGSYSRNSLGSTFTIGSGTNPDYLWTGQIDQVKIWGSVLDAGDIEESMHAYQKGSRTAGDSLLAHYDFNDFTQGVVPDRAGNGNNLTLASSITDARFTSSQIIESGTAHTEQSYVKFNRSYLTATGGWTPPTGVTNYKALVVAGGGGGGGGPSASNHDHHMNGGGGGAGGITESDQVSLSPNSVITVVVGHGGSGTIQGPTNANTASAPSNGGYSQLGSISTLGGGAGGYMPSTGTVVAAKSGGSGGGGGAQANPIYPILGGGGTSGQGNDGGDGFDWNQSYQGSGGGGGAAEPGGDANPSIRKSGDGGAGLSTSITGQTVFYAGGGGGGARADSAGTGGIGGGGNGAVAGAGSNGTPGLGGGGGGGSANGGSGGSGVVILSWGPYLEVTQSPTVARAGDVFRDAIKLQVMDEGTGQPFTANYPVTVTASANVLTLNGVLLTQSYTVQSSAVDGTVDFSGLGFASNVSGDVTLTFTSDEFVGTSLVVTPRYFPTDVNIATGVTTGGTFFEGSFYANNSSGTTNISTTDLVAHLASYSTVISASGYVTVTNGFTTTATSSITLRAGAYVNVAANQQIRTAGGDIVLWADSDQNSAGFVRLLDNSELCTTGGTCGTTTTGGGDIVIGGGAPDANDSSRPGGYAVGSGGSDASDGTSDTSGVAFGRLGIGSSGPQLYSAGGDISVKGQMSVSTANTWRAGVAVIGGTTINAGIGKIFMSGKATTSGGDASDGTIALGAWGGGFQFTSMNTASDAVVIEGIDNDSDRTIYGIWEGHDLGVITSAGGFQLRANHINDNLDMDLSVSGVIVIEPQSTSLRDSENATSFVVDIVDSSVTAGDTIRLLTAPAGIRIGSASNSNQVILNTSFTSAGDIEVIAGSIDAYSNPQIVTTGLGAGVLLKASNWIDFRAGTNSTTSGKIQTNNGDIIFWSDSDGDGAGSIGLGTYSVLNSANGVESKTASGGGRITLAGGNDGVDADGHPLGFAGDFGQFYGANNYWSILIQPSKIFSGGGDVTFRARSDYGSLDTMRIDGGSQVWSGTGAIRADVRKVGAGNTFYMYQNSWVSAATTSPAIEINAQSTGTGGVFESLSDGTSLVALGTGGIAITSTTSGTTVNAITMLGMDLLSREGDIQISTNGRFSWATNAARAIGGKASSDVTTSSANVQISTQAFLDSTANTASRISTSGAVEILPSSGSFNDDSHLNFEVEAGSFAFGNVSDVNNSTKNIKLWRDITVAGPITVSAAAITVDLGVDLISTGLGAPILLKAKQFIDIENLNITDLRSDDSRHSVIQSNNGDIIFWADSDANEQGLIWVPHNTRINSANGVYSYDAVSGGGDIIFAGGADDGTGRPGGYAWDNGNRSESVNANDMGVGFGRFVDVFTGGGDLIIRAKAKNAGLAAFHFQGPSNFVTGTGQLIIDAEAESTIEAFEFFDNADRGTLFSSHATLSPAISISAVSANQVAFELRTSDSSNPSIIQSLATEGGGVSITANRTTSLTGAAARFSAVNVLSRNGAITVSSDAKIEVTTYGGTQNWGAAAGSDVNSSSADITFTVNLWDSNSANRDKTSISTSGAVKILPNASDFANTAETYFIFNVIDSGSFTLGKESGVASANSWYEFLGTVYSRGPIEIYGNRLAVRDQNDLVVTGAGNRLLIKLRENMYVSPGSGTADSVRTKFQTNGGDLVIWVDADGNSVGALHLEAYFYLNSYNGVDETGAAQGGGDIIIGGGTQVDADGYPTGSVKKGTSWGHGDRAITMGSYGDIFSGGGDISIKGGTDSSYGILVWPGIDIYSGNGQIQMVGSTSGSGGMGVAFIDWSNPAIASPWNVVSNAQASPAISITGTATTREGLRLWGANAAHVLTFASTATIGGGVELIGRSSAGAVPDFHLKRVKVLSKAGPITVSAGVNILSLDYGGESGLNVFGADPAGSIVTTSSADINLVSDKWDFDATGHQFNTSGDVSVLPYTNNYFGANTTFGFATDNIRNFTIGKPPTAGDSSPTITITGTHSVSGAIRIYGGTLNLAGTSNYLRAAGTISMVANDDIDVQENITTFGGPIVLWSNADGTTTSTGGGRIDLDAAATLTSNGGDVVFGGGTSANYLGYPTGNAKSQDASSLASIDLYGDIDSSGGDVIMLAEGQSGAGTNAVGAIMMRLGSQISSGAGDISISGRVPSDTTSSGNQWGIWFGSNTTANQPTITSTTGDISLLGDATAYISNARTNRPGIVLYSGLIQSDTGDISIEGRAAQHSTGDYVDVTGWDAGGVTISSSGNVTLAGRAGGTVNLQRLTVTNAATLSILSDSLASGVASTIRADRIVIDHAPGSSNGTAVLQTPANLTIQSSTGDLVMGSSEVGRVLVTKAVSVSGDVRVQAAQVSVSANVFAGGNSPSITISADVLDVSASVKATGGNLALLANTAGRGIMLGGTTTSALLQVSDSELDQLFATNLRIGDSSTADIYIAGDISISSSRVTNLLLRSAGDVIASAGAEITAQNIAIEAGGIIDLIGENAVSGNVALSASSGVSYSSAVSYSPAAVAEFVPVFGIGAAVSQTNSPTVSQANEFLAVTFNPPPQFVVTDSYSNTLDLNNRLAASFTVSATVTQGTGTVTGLTASFSAGVYSFNSLRVDTNPGTYSFTISVDDGLSGFSTTSIDYSVLGAEPSELVVIASDSTAPAGEAGFDITVRVEDAQGNGITSGPNAGLTVSASISGQDGVILTGDKVSASTSNGLADFAGLIVGGKTSVTYSLSFSVTFTDSNSQVQTLTSSAIAITLTHGAADQLTISPSSVVATYGQTISGFTVQVLDSYSNVVTASTATIQAFVDTATLSGTVALSATAGEATFGDLSLVGSKTAHSIVFESTGMKSTSATINLINLGALSLARNADVGLVGEDFMVQPLIQVLDSEGSTTTISGLSISATVSAGASLAGAEVIVSNAGVGTFADLGLGTGALGGLYEITYSAPGYDPVTQSTTVYSVPVELSVTATGLTEGVFHNGLFYASSLSANILNTDLNSALDLRSITLSSSADIHITEAVSATSAGNNFTLRSGGSIHDGSGNKAISLNNATFSAIANGSIDLDHTLTTAGGNVFIQTRAQDAAVGSFYTRRLIDTGGGDLFVAGGSDPQNGFAIVTGAPYYSGIYVEDITTNGGSVQLRGATSQNTQSDDEYGIRFQQGSRVETSGGDVRLIGQLNRTTSPVAGAFERGILFSSQTGISSYVDTGSGDLIVSVESSADQFAGLSIWATATDGDLEATTTTGDISISALIAPRINNYNQPVRGRLNLSSQTGDILLSANKDNVNRTYWSPSTIQTAGLMKFDLPETYFYAGQTFTGSGQVVITDVQGQGPWNDNVTFGNSLTGLQIGPDLDETTNENIDLSRAQISINGPISLNGGNIVLGSNALIESTSQSADVRIRASRDVEIPVGTSVITSGGDIEIEANQSQKKLNIGGSISAGGSGSINLDSRHLSLTGALSAPNGSVLLSSNIVRFQTVDTTNVLALSDSEANRIDTPRLTIAATSRVEALEPISFSQPEVLLIARSGVLQSTGATLSALNLAISSSSTVNLPEANQVGGNLAIRGTSVTYSSAVNYTAATVSGVTPEFGIPVTISATSIPGSGSTDVFLGATISPAPVVTVRDVFGQPLSDKNLLASLYTVSANVATGTATLVGQTASSIVGGVQTFDQLAFASGSGTPTLDFKLFGPDGQVGTNLNSGTYSLSSADPSSLSTSVTVAISPAGIAGFAMTVTVLDEDANGMSSGPNVGLTVSASVSGESVSILSGGQVQADSSGVADFTNLVLAGSVSDSVSISFFVEFEDFEGNPQTLSSEVFSLSLTPGAPTNLVVDSGSQIKPNRAVLEAIQISLHDAFGNVVLDRTDNITADIVPGSGGTLSGTTQVAVPANASASAVVSFTDLIVSGLVGQHVIEFASDQQGIATVSHTVTLTHGPAAALAVATAASGARSGIDFSQQPVIEIQDEDGNRVSTSAIASHAIEVSYIGQPASAGGVDLSGTTTINATFGAATFTDLRLTGVSSSYTLRFALSSDSSFSVSQQVGVGAGEPSKIAITQQPGDILAGEQFAASISVQIQDANGNHVASLTESTTVQAIFVDLAGNEIASYSPVGSNAGNVVFDSLSHTLAGDYRLRFVAGSNSSVSPLTSVTSIAFSISHNVAHELAWVSGTEPSAASNDGVISPAPSMQILDEYGNAVSTGPTVEIVASVTGSNVADVLSIAGSSSTSVNDVVTFNALALRALVGNYQLQFTGTVSGVEFDTLDSPSALVLGFGVPKQLAITTGSSGARAGLPFDQTPVVEVRDSAGNLVTNSSLDIEATSSDAVLIGSTTLSAVAGIAGFASDLGLAGSASSTITMSYIADFGGTQISISETISLLAGLPSSLRVFEDASTVSTRAIFSPAPSVEVLDAYGNVVLSDNDTEVTVSLYRNGVAISSESDPVTASSGVVAFNGLSYIATPNSNYKLQFSHTSISAVVTSSPFVIEPGPVAKVVIHQQPRTITGGVTTTKTGELFEDNAVVRLYDIDDNLVHTVDSGVITAAITSGSGGTLISASASITNGSAEFEEMRLVGVVETPEQSAQEYKLTFSYGGFSSSESDVLKVKHNVATQLTVVQSAADGRASAIFTTQPRVRLLDRYGNWVSTGTNVTVQADVVDENGVGSPTIVGGDTQTSNGEATLFVGISGTAATTYTLRFVATTNQGVEISTAEQTGITITHGSASRVRILRELSSDDGSGNLTKTGSALNVQPVVEVVDANNNRVLDFTGIIRASLSATVRAERDYLISNTVSAVAGVATFSGLALVGEVGTDYRVNFYRDGFVGNSAESVDFALTHADAEYLTIETQPAGGNKTGSALSQSPTIAVRDFDGNITTTLNSQTISAAVFSGGGSVDTTGSNTDEASVVNGIAQFSNLTVVALPSVDQSLVFTLDGAANSASGLVTSSASVTFSLIVSDAYQLSVFTEPCTAADCTAGPTAELLGVQPVVEVQDRFGNRVVGFSGSVTATLQGTGGSLRDADGQISSRSVAVSSGLATFTGLRIEGVPGNNYSLQFATSGLQSTTSQDVQVIHTTPSQLVITQQPVGGVTGDELASQPVVEVRDSFGNLAVTDNATTVSVSVFSGPSRLSGLAAEVTGSLTVTAVNGVATFSGLELFARTGENYVLKFAASGFDVLSNGVVVSPAGANSLEWVTEPVAQRTGEVMNVQPVLRMLDFDGNIAASTSATVVASVTNGGGSIEAGTTSSAVEGIITFAGLTLVALPNVDQTLTFTATTASGSFSITTVTPLNVQHAAASTMSIDVGYATSNEQGLVLGTQPVIKLYDRFGNPTVNDNSTVVTATVGSGAGGAISGSATATAVGGVVTFAGLAVTGSPGVDYTLDFSAGAYGVSGSAQLRLFKTAALEVSYSNIVYSSSPTTSPAIAFTDSTEHSISYSVSTTDICTINATSGEVNIVGAGTCVIQVSVADGTYYKATSKDVNLTIEKAQQDPVVITNNAFVNFGDVLTLTSSGGSSNATTRFFATGECQILGNSLITFGSATEGAEANCTILASRNGDANYLASTAAPMDIEIRRVAQQPISIGNARNISVGDVELFLIGGSGTGAVSYDVQLGTNTAGCAVTDGLLSATKNGSCEVVATKAQSTNYNVATSAVATFTFTKQTQTVTIISAAPTMPLPGQSFQVVATASGATTISYAVTKGQAIAETQFVSASPAVCQLSQSVSGQVTFLRSGECEVTATAASSDKFASATGKMNILVGQLNQFITFDALSNKTFGDPAFRLSAVASSGLPVSFSVSAGVSVCSISNSMVTINAAGVCEITASQAGNGSYAPAPNVVRSFVVNPGVASSPALISAAVGNQWFTLRFTEPSNNGGSDIVAYRLEVRDQNDNLYVSTTTNTQSPLSATAVGIPNNTPYTAKVTAITAAGLGQFSSTTVPLTPSDAAMSVTQLSADTSTSGLDLSWVTPEAIEGNFLRYEVYAWVTGNEEPSTPTVTLTDSTSDSVTVATSSISNDVSVSPASYVAPRLEIVQPLFRPNGGVHIFGAAKTKPIGFFALASISQPSTASATVGYTMRVVTITDVKSSSQVINTANGVKVGLSAPSAPTQFNIDSSDLDKLVITWAAPNSDGGFPLIDYQVTSNGQVICANIQTRLCEVSPLALSTTYNIEVKARNALGLGDAAAGSHTTPDPAPVVNTTALNEQTQQLVSNLPKLSIFQPRIVRPGELVTVTGEKLNILNTLSLGGVTLDFTVLDSTSLTFRVPVATEPGSYNIIHTSAFGTVTAMDALMVAGTPVEEEVDPVERPETEVPVVPETVTPETPISPEGGSQAPNAEGGSNEAPQVSPQEPGESEAPTEPAPTQDPKPTPTGSADPVTPESSEPGEEVVASGPRDSSPILEFSVSLAMIMLMLLALLLVRYRKERSDTQ